MLSYSFVHHDPKHWAMQAVIILVKENISLEAMIWWKSSWPHKNTFPGFDVMLWGGTRQLFILWKMVTSEQSQCFPVKNVKLKVCALHILRHPLCAVLHVPGVGRLACNLSGTIWALTPVCEVCALCTWLLITCRDVGTKISVDGSPSNWVLLEQIMFTYRQIAVPFNPHRVDR